MVRRAWLMAVVGAFVIWFAVFVVAGCSGTRSKGETWVEYTEPTAVHDEATFVQIDQAIAQLDQEIQLKPPPAYEIADESDSSAFSCEPEDLGYDPSVCSMVLTEATGAMKLASITEDIITNPDYYVYALVLRVQFLDKSEFDLGAGDDIATSYCFKRKSVAVSALGSALKHAVLLGKIDNCYLTLYREGDAELLKPFH